MKRSPPVRLLHLILARKWFKAAHLIRRKARELRAEYQRLDKESQQAVESILVENKSTSSTRSITYMFSSISPPASPIHQDEDHPCIEELYLRHILPEAILQKAPKYVLKAIIELNPGILLTLPDAYGRLPLHIACLEEGAASFSTIKMLLSLENPKGIHCDEHFSEQASDVDCSNRKPLHYAIERLISCCRKYSEGNVPKVYIDPDSEEVVMKEKRGKEKEEILDIISLLLQTHPDAVLHADEKNDTPIDLLQKARRVKKIRNYEKDNEAIDTTCKLMRKKAVEVYRRRKLMYELLGCDSYNTYSQENWDHQTTQSTQQKKKVRGNEHGNEEICTETSNSSTEPSTTHFSSSIQCFGEIVAN